MREANGFFRSPNPAAAMMIEQVIVTDRPRGKGVDPNQAGFQVAAKSSGLTQELIQEVYRLAANYGAAVYGEHEAVRVAKRKERAWKLEEREHTGSRPSSVLPEICALFPEVFAFDRIDGEETSYVITRVRYVGFVSDGRSGNYLAHSLIVDEDALDAIDSNPFPLLDSNQFFDAIDEDTTELPSLDSFAPIPRVKADNPIDDKLEIALATAMRNLPLGETLIFTTSDAPDERRQLLSVIFSLLPPAWRRRATFTTFAPNLDQERHALAAWTGSLGPTPQIGPGSTVFDHEERRFYGPSAEPGYCDQLVCNWLREGKSESVSRLHQFLDSVGAVDDPTSWDGLVACQALLSTDASVDELIEVLQQGESLAPATLRGLLPHLGRQCERFAAEGDIHSLMRLGSEGAGFVVRASEDAGDNEHLAEFRMRMSRGAQDAFWNQGDPESARALLNLSGISRAALLENLETSEPTPVDGISPTMLRLLVDGANDDLHESGIRLTVYENLLRWLRESGSLPDFWAAAHQAICAAVAGLDSEEVDRLLRACEGVNDPIADLLLVKLGVRWDEPLSNLTDDLAEIFALIRRDPTNDAPTPLSRRVAEQLETRQLAPNETITERLFALGALVDFAMKNEIEERPLASRFIQLMKDNGQPDSVLADLVANEFYEPVYRFVRDQLSTTNADQCRQLWEPWRSWGESIPDFEIGLARSAASVIRRSRSWNPQQPFPGVLLEAGSLTPIPELLSALAVCLPPDDGVRPVEKLIRAQLTDLDDQAQDLLSFVESIRTIGASAFSAGSGWRLQHFPIDDYRSHPGRSEIRSIEQRRGLETQLKRLCVKSSQSAPYDYYDAQIAIELFEELVPAADQLARLLDDLVTQSREQADSAAALAVALSRGRPTESSTAFLQRIRKRFTLPVLEKFKKIVLAYGQLQPDYQDEVKALSKAASLNVGAL
ncbi:MAG: hypothetical protein AAF585_04560 [Verrucomicrobiota bacterium]